MASYSPWQGMLHSDEDLDMYGDRGEEMASSAEADGMKNMCGVCWYQVEWSDEEDEEDGEEEERREGGGGEDEVRGGRGGVPRRRPQYMQCGMCDTRCHRKCLKKGLMVQIENGMLNSSWPCCGFPFPEEELRTILDDALVRKLEYYRNRRDYLDRKDVVFCPKEECRQPNILKEREGSVTVCKRCSTSVCTKCEQEAHGSSPCVVPRQNVLDGTVAHLRLLRTRKCPRCTVRIAKISGCNHIYCRLCGTDFCWICRGVLVQDSATMLRECHCPDVRIRDHTRAVVLATTAAIVFIPMTIAEFFTNTACALTRKWRRAQGRPGAERKKKAHEQMSPLRDAAPPSPVDLVRAHSCSWPETKR